jgi:N utilization substance protein A
MALPGVGISLADALYEKGFYSAEEISKASLEDLLQIRGVDEPMARGLIAAAQAAAEQAAAAAPESESAGEASELGNDGDEAGDREAEGPADSGDRPADGSADEA